MSPFIPGNKLIQSTVCATEIMCLQICVDLFVHEGSQDKGLE